MALLHLDRRLRGPLVALAAASALLCLQPLHAASDKCETAGWSYKFDSGDRAASGDMSYRTLELRQCSTLMKASRAEASGIAGGSIRNSIWKLTGAVHFEFNGAVLDAPAATVVFADGRLKTVQVQPAPAQPPQQPKNTLHMEFEGAVLDAQTATVDFADGRMKTVQSQGVPAQFSHQLKNSARRVHGHATRIDYDPGKSLMHFNGDAWFSTGNDDLETQSLTYNLVDGSTHGAASTGTFRPDEPVPAPRTPDRASAK